MATMPTLTYPTPPTTDQVDDYHGTAIADPYRPLEDSDAPATRAWIEAENELTERVLAGWSGERVRQVTAEREAAARIVLDWHAHTRSGESERWQVPAGSNAFEG